MIYDEMKKKKFYIKNREKSNLQSKCIYKKIKMFKSLNGYSSKHPLKTFASRR